jgi:hypothetical protein
VLAAPLSTVGGGSSAAIDFNGDGNLDLVVTLPFAGTDESGNGFVVLLGNGNGTFQPPQAFAAPQKPVGLAAGPLTKGGHPGIAVSGYASSDVYLYLGNGSGGFSAPEQIYLPGTTGTGGLAIGDLTGDGYPDVVSSEGYIVFGTAGGASQPVYYPVADFLGTYGLVLADLRKNGLTDIVTYAHAGVSVLLNQGNGKYEDGEWTMIAGGAGCGVTADFNSDGKPDLAVNTPSGISILLGTGNAKSPFKAGATIPLAGVGCLVTGDLNGDGIPDLLVPVNGTPNRLLTYLGNGNGTFRLKSATATPNSGGYVVLADLNHDGKLDFATSGNLLALGNGDGTFQKPTAFVSNPPSSGFSNIAVGDINNDGWPDLVLTNSAVEAGETDLYVLLNNQEGGFNQVPTNFGALTNEAILADLNGDGNLDVVLQGISSGGAFVYLGDGTGAFTYQTTLADPLGIPGLNLVADLNGDGIPDIAVLESDTLEVFLGLGGATYAIPFDIGTGPFPGTILTVNLHGQPASSGLPDIAAPDNSGGVMVLINKTK